MGLQDSRLWQWAANQFYAANGSGNLWRNGTTPTKLEPSGADLAEGMANDVDVRAEVVNYMLNAQDSVRNGLLLDRLATFVRQVDLNASPAIPYRPDLSWYEASYSQTSNPAAQNERASTVFSLRRRAFVHPLTTNIISLRLADGRSGRGQVQTWTEHASINEWTRGVYVEATTAATAWAVLINLGASTSPQLQAISDSGVTQIAPLLAGHTMVDVQPIRTGGSGSGLARVRLLTTSGGVFYLVTYNPATNTWAAVSTGLSSAVVGAQLHRLASGRLWVTTSLRAAYSDNDGVTWNFDGAAAGASQGEYCVYDAANARWVRFSWADVVAGGLQISIAANPNNPTARAVLKQIPGLTMRCAPTVWGRYVYAIMGDPGAALRPMISPDYGITWLPCSEHFFNTTDDPGPVGTSPPFNTSHDIRIATTAIGVCASYRNTTGTNMRTRMMVTKPMAETDSVLAYV